MLFRTDHKVASATLRDGSAKLPSCGVTVLTEMKVGLLYPCGATPTLVVDVSYRAFMDGRDEKPSLGATCCVWRGLMQLGPLVVRFSPIINTHQDRLIAPTPYP
jgi:hypothetical protein